MPYSGQTFTIVNIFIPNTTIESSAVNQNFNDIAANGLSVVVKLNGDSTMTGQFKAANGTAAAPGITFGSDTNIGFYRIGADQIGVSIAGTLAATWDATGLTMASGYQFVGTGGSVSEPDYSFAGDLNTGWYSAGADAPALAAGGVKVLEGSTTGVNFPLNVTQNGAAIAFTPPGGRITLTSATPVLTSDVTAAATIYYSPYLNNFASLWNGTGWVQNSFSELSQALSDNTKSPAATTANNNYDMFLWNDSGTMRCTRGPAWTSSTNRGTGAGTSEISRVNNGIYVNTNAVTNGPAAGYGLYVGTIRTNSSNSVDMMFAPSAAAGGTANRLFVWNMYNRTDMFARCQDSTATWQYQTATLRAANNSTSNAINFIVGLAEDAFLASYNVAVLNSQSNIEAYIAIGYDSTSAAIGGKQTIAALLNTIRYTSPTHVTNAFPTVGLHYIQALEASQAGSNFTTWAGTAGLSSAQSMELNMKWRM